MNIEIIRKDKETKTAEKYEFTIFHDYTNEITLVLDNYVKYTEKPRKVLTKYSRIMHRDSTITEDEIIIPEEVAKDAIENVIKNISIKKWSEYRR